MLSLIIKGSFALLLTIVLAIGVVTLSILTVTYLCQFIFGIFKCDNLTDKCITLRESYFRGFKNLLKRKSK